MHMAFKELEIMTGDISGSLWCGYSAVHEICDQMLQILTLW
jgi:hypothetical protein